MVSWHQDSLLPFDVLGFERFFSGVRGSGFLSAGCWVETGRHRSVKNLG